MKREKNAYFLIKACRFSITQHMSDQQHWWAHQTKKTSQISSPPLDYDLLENPLLFLSGSLIWTLFQTLIYPEKAHWAQLPPFHQRPHWYSYVSLCSHLGANRKTDEAGVTAVSAKMSRCLAHENLSLALSVFPDRPSWSAVAASNFPGERLFLRICLGPFSTLCLCFSLTANPPLSCWNKVKNSAAATNEQAGTVARKSKEFPTFSVGQRTYILWELIHFMCLLHFSVFYMLRCAKSVMCLWKCFLQVKIQNFYLLWMPHLQRCFPVKMIVHAISKTTSLQTCISTLNTKQIKARLKPAL